jgi:hypothetical protein
MTDPRRLESYAQMGIASSLKDVGAYAVSRVNEQMLLPTMEVYLSTVVLMPASPRKRLPRTPRSREKASHTIQMWERLS